MVTVFSLCLFRKVSSFPSAMKYHELFWHCDWGFVYGVGGDEWSLVEIIYYFFLAGEVEVEGVVVTIITVPIIILPF